MDAKTNVDLSTTADDASEPFPPPLPVPAAAPAAASPVSDEAFRTAPGPARPGQVRPEAEVGPGQDLGALLLLLRRHEVQGESNKHARNFDEFVEHLFALSQNTSYS